MIFYDEDQCYYFLKIFCSFSALTGTRQSRLQQLINWCGGKDFDGCLIFDECHKAKNFVPVSQISFLPGLAYCGSRIHWLRFCRGVRPHQMGPFVCCDTWGWDLNGWAVDDPGYWEVISSVLTLTWGRWVVREAWSVQLTSHVFILIFTKKHFITPRIQRYTLHYII